jgi:nitronate monooxygenase
MPLRSLFGTELPLVQAPMAGVQGGRLAAAVSNAGALGSLPAALLSLEALETELRALPSATARPFNVNFFCHAEPRRDAAREQAWRARLAPFYAELGLDIAAIPEVPQRLPFSAAAMDLLETCRPAVVSFHFGLPAPALLRRVRALGCAVIASATTVREAAWLAERGVDAIVAQGVEAGGHRGMFLDMDLATQIGTLDLVRGIAARVKTPIVAAGGIATATDVAAALDAGAAGVQAGTAYLLADEADTGAVHRAAVQGPGAAQTAITNVFTGRPARGMVNRLMRELGIMSPLAPAFPLAVTATLPLRIAAERAGSGDFSPLWCGTRAVECRAAPAAAITAALAAGLR